MMKLTDPFLFLIGDREAIQRIAGSWWSILIGFILVLTAGIARNYDHLSMLDTVEWFVGPIAASLISSMLIFWFGLWRYISLKWKDHSWLTLLSCYWMTAPCAWLYGIPVEAFTDLYSATQWNIAFLAIVSVWRVVLMARVLSVLTGDRFVWTCTSIMMPASVIMFFAAANEGMNIVGIMGGVRLPPHTELLYEAANFTVSVSMVLFCISILLLAYSFTDKRKRVKLKWQGTGEFPKSALIMTCGILVVFSLAVIPLQLKVQRNEKLASLIRSENPKAAVEYASQFKQEDFSRIHYLPPTPYYRGVYLRKGETLDLLLEQCDESTPKWLVEEWQYQRKLVDEVKVSEPIGG